MSKKPVWYWDSCIFLAWLNGEDSIYTPSVMDGIREMVKDIDSGRAVMFTSVMTKTEVFHKLKTQWARDEYTRFCQRDNVSVVAQDERVMDKSSEIREHYSKKSITLDAGDCVHLATAILYKADVFYTLDGESEKPKPNALLPLDGNVAGNPLKIKKPSTEQGSLFTGVPMAVSSALKSGVGSGSVWAVPLNSKPEKEHGGKSCEHGDNLQRQYLHGRPRSSW